MKTSKIKISATLSSDGIRLISKLGEEYKKAEKLCKEVEGFRDEAGIPAMNELRYAGYHLLVYIESVANRATPDLDELRTSISHCRRAAYEAGEAGILAALTIVDIFKHDYESVTISDIVPDWKNILRRCDEIRDTISAARQTGEDRSNDHKMYGDSFRELKEFCKTVKYSRDDLNKKIDMARSSNRKFILTTLIGLIGLIVVIVFGFMK